MMNETRRKTKETEITVKINLQPGPIDMDIPCPFLAHMLEQLLHHAGWSGEIRGKGDTDIDYHHLTEDVGVTLGIHLNKIFSKNKYKRYGWCLLPMDGSLVMVAVDMGGRAYCSFDATFPAPKCGDFDMELVEEFFRALSREGRMTIHIKSLSCDNSHHLAEGIFKGVGLSLGQAMTPSQLNPSTKGVWA